MVSGSVIPVNFSNLLLTLPLFTHDTNDPSNGQGISDSFLLFDTRPRQTSMDGEPAGRSLTPITLPFSFSSRLRPGKILGQKPGKQTRQYSSSHQGYILHGLMRFLLTTEILTRKT
jgi:hypothetical protein